jgi:hypothetical protein
VLAEALQKQEHRRSVGQIYLIAGLSKPHIHESVVVDEKTPNPHYK